MNKRIRYRTRRRTKIKLKTVLMAGTVAFGMMAGTILVTLNLLENEPTSAGSDPMVVDRIFVFQDTTALLKGSTNQLVLGIKVITKGKTQNLNLAHIDLSARGSTKPVTSLISNARLWFTGNNDFFTPTRQLGETITEIPEENFTITAQQKLLPGSNFFWVTYDIKNIPGSKTCFIDAECVSAQIGTLLYEPDRSAPPGSHRIINNIPYYSTNNGDISSLETWNTSRDGSGKRLTSFNLPFTTFHIQSGHILHNRLNACIPFLVVERNGVLISNSAIKSEHLEIQSGGTVVQQKAIVNANTTESFIIHNGGNYIHKNSGPVPGKIKRFAVLSNVVLNDYSAATFETPCNWGNLIIDGNVNENVDFKNSFKYIQGNLELRNTGNKNYLYTTLADTINIFGNLVINGGHFALVPSENTMILNVSEEFILRRGSFSDALPTRSAKGTLEFYPGKRIYLKGGNFILIGKHSRIELDDELVSWVQDTANVMLPDLNVLPGCTLHVAGKNFGNLGAGKNLVVTPTAVVNCGKTEFTGEGTFRLEPNSTIITSHVSGINSESDLGSIRFAKRFFSSGANYIFSGNSTPQMTGIFKTQPAANTVNRLTINKRPNAVLILEQNLRATGGLIKGGGSINKNGYELYSGDKETAIVTP